MRTIRRILVVILVFVLAACAVPAAGAASDTSVAVPRTPAASGSQSDNSARQADMFLPEDMGLRPRNLVAGAPASFYCSIGDTGGVQYQYILRISGVVDTRGLVGADGTIQVDFEVPADVTTGYAICRIYIGPPDSPEPDPTWPCMCQMPFKIVPASAGTPESGPSAPVQTPGYDTDPWDDPSETHGSESSDDPLATDDPWPPDDLLTTDTPWLPNDAVETGDLYSPQPSYSPAPSDSSAASHSSRPTDTPSQSSSQSGTMPTVRPSYAPGPTMPAPVPDPVVSGYMVFEARGHRIAAVDAEESIKAWAATAGFPERTAVDVESDDALLSTGDGVLVSYPNGFSTRYAVIIRGDVTGSGLPGLTQLVQLVRVLNRGAEDQTEETSADVNADGGISLSDLVALAGDMRHPDQSGPRMASESQIFARRSSNALQDNYSTYGSTVKSYVYENPNGGLTRVEYTDGRIVVEDYDGSFRLLTTRSTEPELPLWGGFFAGRNYNYVIVGQKNDSENNSHEVIRVIQYDKQWNRINAASLRGANTTEPFAFGSLRCDEFGGYLYVRTSHLMYTSPDGLRHQANIMFSVREDDMQITDSYYAVSNLSYGYVSHSFNEFVKIDDNGRIFTVDQGDAYPRGAAFFEYGGLAGRDLFVNQRTNPAQLRDTVFQHFSGAIGDNVTGASIGGFELTNAGCLCTYNYNESGQNGVPRDVYVYTVNKTTGESRTEQITRGADASTPKAASTGGGTGYIIWMEGISSDTPQFCYTAYTGDGKTESIRSAEAVTSDCQPIPWHGGLLWYVTDDHSGPVFYTLNDSGAHSISAQDS